MSEVKSADIVTAEEVPEVILDEQKNEKEVAEADAEVAVVAEADDGTTEPEEVVDNDKEETNGTAEAEVKEVEHKNGDATPKANGDANGTTKDADELELKRKGGDEAPEPVVEGVSPEKKLKLVEADNSEKDEAVEANGEATEVSS